MINLICFAAYGVLAIFWVILLIVGGKKYKQMIQPLQQKKYWLKDLYPVGFAFLDLIHYSFRSNLDRKRLADAKIVWGERYGEYYYRVNVAEKATYALTLLVFTPLIGPAFGEPLYMLFGVICAVVTVYYADTKITDITKEREEEIMRDFVEMVSKLTLLINAGMITREAWTEISNTGTGTLYEEMQNAVIDMQNGVSEIDAYIGFGNRCGSQLAKKFTSMLVQNLSKGNKELVEFLRKETDICWEEKQHLVKRQGEAAANKLMLPLGMIFIGIFIMILVPIASQMGL